MVNDDWNIEEKAELAQVFQILHNIGIVGMIHYQPCQHTIHKLNRTVRGNPLKLYIESSRLDELFSNDPLHE